MTGKRGNKKAKAICPLCGGTLKNGRAMLPFYYDDGRVVMIRGVPAEICQDCHEPYVAGGAVDIVERLLDQLESVQAEVLIVIYKAA
jgi:YgiT-type zinc finger domain-containing protein